jgi:glyoxylase-like metal-dependent hydrolase (beta-lactamase superfamily II)
MNALRNFAPLQLNEWQPQRRSYSSHTDSFVPKKLLTIILTFIETLNMDRRRFIQSTAVLAGAGIFLRNPVLANLFPSAPFTIRMVRNNVGIFTERGGTIGFAETSNGIIAIDSQFPDTAGHFIDEVKARNAKPFLYLLNTHHHGDHTGGNIAFKGLVQHVVAHENSLKHQKAAAEKQNALEKTVLPDLTFSKKTKIKAGDTKVRGYYFGAGHTNGDAVWHFQEANVAHMGDLMFNKRHPFVDRASGASMQNWIDVLEKTIKKFDQETIYIFGHALNPGEETGNREDLKKFQDYLDKVLRFAESEIKSGKSKEEFIKSTAIPGVTEWTGDGIQRPLTAAYEEVSGGKN